MKGSLPARPQQLFVRRCFLLSGIAFILMLLLSQFSYQAVTKQQFNQQQQQQPMVQTINQGDNVLGNYAPPLKSMIQSVSSMCFMKNNNNGGGDLYFSDSKTFTLRMLNSVMNRVEQIAGSTAFKSGFTINVPPKDALFGAPSSLICDQESGLVYMMDSVNKAILRVSSTKVEQVATLTQSDDGTRPGQMFQNSAGDILFVDKGEQSIKKLTQGGSIGVVLQPGVVSKPVGLVQTKNGDLYISTDDHVIMLFKDGQLSTFAGQSGKSGNQDGPLSQSRFNMPGHLAIVEHPQNRTFTLYVSDSGNHVVKQISSNAVQTIAGNGVGGDNGDGLALNVQLSSPMGLILINDILHIADPFSNRIRRLVKNSKSGEIFLETIIGGNFQFDGYNVPTQYALFKKARELSVNSKGDLFTLNENRVLKISNNFVSNFISFSEAFNIAINSKDELFIGSTDQVFKIDQNNQLEPFALDPTGLGDDNVNALNAILQEPSDLATDSNGMIYIVEKNTHRIRVYNPVNKIISNVVGLGQLGNPRNLFITQSNDLYFSEHLNHIIRMKSDNDQDLKIIVGQAELQGYSSGNGIAINAMLNKPSGIFIKDNQLYFCDTGNFLIRKVNLNDGTIVDIAGTPTIMGSMDGDANQALFISPRGIVVRSNGDIIVSDGDSIRQISNGKVSTLSGREKGWLDGNLTESQFSSPDQIRLISDDGSSFELLVSDAGNNCIRKISQGLVKTIAGISTKRGFKDNTKASDAVFNLPSSIIQMNDGRILVCDSLNGRIREISAQSMIETIVGGIGDGVNAMKAVASINEMAFTNQNELLIADIQSNCIRMITKEGIIVSIAGNGQSAFGEFSPDGSNAKSVALNTVSSISECDGTVYFVEGSLLRYIKEGKLYSLGEADHITCDIVNKQLIAVNEKQVFSVRNFQMNAISGPVSAPNTDGPLNAVSFSNPIGSVVLPDGNMYISEWNYYSNLKRIGCESGYKMVDYSTCLPSCNGMTGNEACGGITRGKCIAPNQCQCVTQFAGSACESDNCFGIGAGNSSVCSGNGKCIGYQNCKCSSMYTGEKCQLLRLVSFTAQFKEPTITIGSASKILLVLNDQGFYQDQQLKFSIYLMTEDRVIVKTVVETAMVSSQLVELSLGETLDQEGTLLGKVHITDVKSNIDIAMNIDFINKLTVVSPKGDSGGSVAIAMIFLLGIPCLIFLISTSVLIVYLWKTRKNEKSPFTEGSGLINNSVL